MIPTESVQPLIGRNAYGLNGEKLGSIGQIYLDNDTGRPEWATVKTGLFGMKESFVPLREAELSDDGLQLPYDKSRIKGAPTIDADREVTPDEELALYDYYGIATTSTGDRRADDRLADDRLGDDRLADDDRERAGLTGHDTSGPVTDDAMTRSEEHVRAGTEAHEAGRARLRKYVVTEQQRVDVPVSHEEVRLEREPITEANRGAATSGPKLSEEEHEVILNEERPVVQKETVPVERVRLDKDRVTDAEQVEVDVRQERIDADTDEAARERR